MIIGEDKRSIDKKSHIVIMALGIAMYIQAMLDYYAQYTVPCDEFGHVWFSFWNHKEINSRNIYDLNFLIVTASIFYLIIQRKKYKRLLIFSLIAEVIALYFNVINKGRTNIVMLIVILFIQMLIYCMNNWKQFDRRVKTVFSTVGAMFILGVAGFSILIHIGKIDAGLDENDKFWARGGGILNNLRFKMAREGLQKALTYGKGGWEVLSGDSNTTHNTFLEYARISDIIVSVLIFLFAIITLVIGIRLLISISGKHPVINLIVGSQIVLFIYFFVEPSGFAQKKLFLLYVFIAGIMTGYYDVINSADYRLLHPLPIRKYDNIAMLFLAYSMINMVYIDYYCDRLAIYMLLIPIAAYLLGEKLPSRGFLIGVVAFICAVVVAITWFNSRNTEYYLAGFVFEPFTGIVVKKCYIIGMAILPFSLIAGAIFKKLKIPKIAVVLISFALAGVYYRNRIMDGRLLNIKEALLLWKEMPWGSFTVTSSIALSSHSMWLDYARDYGIMVAIPLLIFALICLVRFVKLIMSKDRNDWLSYALIVSFILFNVYFSLEAVPYNQKYIFYIALLSWGML